MELTTEEKDFLIQHLEGELKWNSNMSKEHTVFQKRADILKSVLIKIGQHTFKTLLDQNLKS
jgi:hypothetical protein